MYYNEMFVYTRIIVFLPINKVSLEKVALFSRNLCKLENFSIIAKLQNISIMNNS